MELKVLAVQRGSDPGTQKASGTGRETLTELDCLFIRIYEDNVPGRINDERLFMMSNSYENE